LTIERAMEIPPPLDRTGRADIVKKLDFERKIGKE
jgi:hypothetical protein